MRNQAARIDGRQRKANPLMAPPVIPVLLPVIVVSGVSFNVPLGLAAKTLMLLLSPAYTF